MTGSPGWKNNPDTFRSAHDEVTVKQILFLHGDPAKARNDNHLRLPAAFAEAGWSVACEDHESLAIQGNELRLAGRDPADFELLWLLGFGRQVSFFDRMQMLATLPTANFVISVDALVYLHGKHRWRQYMPETHTSSNPEYLEEQLKQGGRWILKPTAGSYGRDVEKIDSISQGRKVIRTLTSRYPDSYLMLQRYIDEIAGGEKRSLVAGGAIIGSYLRIPTRDFRANVAEDAEVAETELTDAERQLVSSIAAELADLGVGFAAIDTVYPYLMEVNVANPGGLQTLAGLGATEAARQTVSAVCRWKAMASDA
jgi:glutathione synthase